MENNNEDYVECPICGTRRKNLTNHMRSAHNLTGDEAKEKFPGLRLICKSVSNLVGLKQHEWFNNENNKEAIKNRNDKSRNGLLRYYSENPEAGSCKSRKMNSGRIEWYESDPEGVRSYKEKVSKTMKKWFKTHPEKSKDRSLKISEWSKNNPEKRAEYNKKISKALKFYCKTHPDDLKERGKKRLQSWYDNPDQRWKSIRRECNHPYELIMKSGEILRLRSPEEVSYAKLLDDNNINFLYESLEIPYYFEEKLRYYYPDFYIPKYNLICEVHQAHLIDNKMLEKRSASISEGYNFIFITNDKLSYIPGSDNNIVREGDEDV